MDKREESLEVKSCENCPYNNPDMDGDVCSKCEEAVVVEIGECQPEDIKTAGEAIREFRCLCFNYQDKWSETTFNYFMKCCDLIEERLAQADNDRKTIDAFNKILEDLYNARN